MDGRVQAGVQGEDDGGQFVPGGSAESTQSSGASGIALLQY